ncbi:hypothetical protein C9374_006850 [Naegleria lovaniensis]|uniref:Uncharacterized protein n=1 Tax=Naegleria lovaniensis TaxID=51637 RepID=A0AA88H479_NAELO|nr:uncharacterized protein C9374_006850 [Naegleria lovaniensis]KAG2393319.1 hypothetical protein C9374_006850 [Naegleria lovaniensis]
MFSPFGRGKPQPPPKRKATNEMKRKLVYFIIGCAVVSIAPYVSEPIHGFISSLLGTKSTGVEEFHYDPELL